MDNYRANFISLIKQAANRHDTWTVFTDFLLMTATAISNSVDKRQFESREKAYMDTVKKYNKNERDLFPKMYAMLTLELQRYAADRQPRDVLGEVFNELELYNKWKGQCFSPRSLCELLAGVSNNEYDVERRGYIAVNEPCCGGGAMLFGFASSFADRGYNYCKQMLVEASDIDIRCVHMTYIQLSLYGIPAKVLHQDTISLKTWSAWYTPVYILAGWAQRENWRRALEHLESITMNAEIAEVMTMLDT